MNMKRKTKRRVGIFLVVAMLAVMIYPASVSYTHLDVYKRQSSECAKASIREIVSSLLPLLNANWTTKTETLKTTVREKVEVR